MKEKDLTPEYRISVLERLEEAVDKMSPKTLDTMTDVFQERLKQIMHKGFDGDHDDQYVNNELVRASAYLLMDMPDSVLALKHGYHDVEMVDFPNWEGSDSESIVSKFAGKTRKEKLVVACALIVAELERISRSEDGCSSWEKEE